MSIYVCGNLVDSKNLWKINDALDTIEASVLGKTTNYYGRNLTIDGNENIYAHFYFDSSANSILKYNTNLILDTSWADAGEISTPGGAMFLGKAKPGGELAVGFSGGINFYNADGSKIWTSSITESYKHPRIDGSTKNVYGFYQSGSIRRVSEFSRLNGTLIREHNLPSGGTSEGTSIVEDRTHFIDPPHLYVHTSHSGVGKLHCFNPETTDNAIWSVTADIVPSPGSGHTIALDSSGYIYIVGSRISGGFGGADYSVMKIDPVDGSILFVFDTGSSALGIAIDGNDNIFVAGSKSGGKCLWKLDTSLVEQGSLSTAVLDTNLRGVGVVPSVTTTTAPPADKTVSKSLVAIGNDQLYYEDSSGSMVQLSDSAGELDVFDYLEAFEAFQKVIIVNGENLKVADFANTCLDLGEGNGLTNPPAKGDVLTQSGSGASMVVDFVRGEEGDENRYIYGYTTTAAAFNVSNTISSNDATATMSPATFTPMSVSEASSAPLWYDYTAYPDIVLSVDKFGQESGTTKSFGSLPSKAYLGCLYRGRVVLSGNPDYPHQWYMSRQANIWDWSYLANDAQTPVAGNNADAGELGDIIRALIPYRDDFLIFGCANSLWLLRGDPAAGGVLAEIDLTVGMFGARSWCFDGDGNLYFWGNNGIYIMPPGFTEIKCLTENVLPNIVSDEAPDPSTHRITMGYDKKRRGILVCITRLEDGSNSNYWYDLRTGGFFPEVYPNECGVYSIFSYDANSKDYADLLLGCRDGYIRKFVDSAKDDDSGDTDTAINSYCVLPITPMGSDGDYEGLLSSLTITTAGGSSGGEFVDTDSVNYELFSADAGEAVLENIIDGDTARESGTITGSGRSNRARKRIRGAYLGIKLSNSNSSETWAIDKVEGNIQQKGRIK